MIVAILFPLLHVLLLAVPPPVAASGDPSASASGAQPETSSAFTPEAPPAACRDCGLQYYPASPAPLPAVSNAVPEASAPAASDAPSNVPTAAEAPASPGRSHLSSDPRVRTARILIARNRFPEALEILNPLVPDHPDQIDVRFLIGLASSRGSQTSGLKEETRLALLDQAIAAFRSILIRRPELVRVRLELALAFYLKEDDSLAREHFERALVGEPPAALAANVQRFLTIMRARKRWNGYFGFSLSPDTNINAASGAEIIYIQGLPFRRGQEGRISSGLGIVGWGGGEYQFPLAERWRLRTGLNVNHREYKGRQFDQTFGGRLRGAALVVQPEDRDEPAGHRQPALVRSIQLQLRLRRAPGSPAPGLPRACN